ncbi:RrF2 family transcriptional regulator [Planctomycetota bacterium]
MNILRQNTDYALRMMGNLAAHYDQGAVSVRVLAQDEEVSYQFACKILQKLHDAHLVESVMGPKGGYRLRREPDQITMLDVVGAMQGELAVNRCTNSNDGCARKVKCPLNGQLCELQQMVDNFMAGVTLQRLQKFKISESE